MKSSSVFVVIALLLSVSSAWAHETGSFTVAGTVDAVRCFDKALPLSPAMRGCEVELSVVTEGERSSILVGCAGDVAEACRWLLPGDAALIAGTAKGPVKRAAHVGLLLSRVTPVGPVVEPPTRPLLLLRYNELANLGDLSIRFVDVVADSRCPTDLTCVWAGFCTVALAVWHQTDFLGTYELTLGPDPGQAVLNIGNHQIRLHNLLPVPRTDIMPIDPEECSVVLETVDLSSCEDPIWCPPDD